MTKTLFFFTISFPFGEGETFIKNEFPFLSKSFEKIIIISSAKGKRPENFPPHVSVYSLEELLQGKNKKKYFLKNLFSISNILAGEFRNCSSSAFFLSNLRQYNSLLINSFICADVISKMKEFKSDAVFYSFWLNNHALTLSILKKQNKIGRFLFRVHGYDLILERWPHKYIAFQHTCHKYADKILTVSKKSLEYFTKTYTQSSKAKSSYLGSVDNGVNPENENSDQIVLVSCSNIIPLKRLHLIIEILKHVRTKVRWIHFGDGFLRDEIIAKSKELTYHEVEFRGRVSQEELFHFYRTNHIDFFINVSDSEGLPFTIIEATSFGIPVIATDAGGTSEIVNEKTGVLLDLSFNIENAASYFNTFKDSQFSTTQFRNGVRNFWKINFSADVVYPKFIEKELLNQGEKKPVN